MGRKRIVLYGKSPQLWIDHRAYEPPDRILQETAEYGLSIYAFAPAAYGYCLGYDEPGMLRCSLDYYRMAIDFCAEAGIDRMLVSIDRVLTADAAYFGNLFHSIARLCAHASYRGVSLLLQQNDDASADTQTLKTLLRENAKAGLSYCLCPETAQTSPRDMIRACGLPGLVTLPDPDGQFGSARIPDGLASLVYAGPLASYRFTVRRQEQVWEADARLQRHYAQPDCGKGGSI